MLKKIFIILSLILPVTLYAQDRIELKSANQLTGKVVDGQQVREASGNVEFQQGNVRVLCNSATQYVEANRVDLRGNVRIFQDTLSLFTDRATYFGNDIRAVCQGGVTLRDPNATLRANNGVYFFNEGRAIFTGNVIIINPEYQITSNELTYMRFTEDSFAKGNVVVTTDSAVIRSENIDFYKREGRTFAFQNVIVESDSTVITSDTATNYSHERRSVASGNVRIESLNNNAVIYGDFLENFEIRNYTIITGDTRLIQIEENDTLLIYSDKMEAFRDPPEHYIATGNVETIRGGFLSKSGTGIYFRDNETISLSQNPVIWQENIQATGDSIYADFPGKVLQTIFIRKLGNISDSKPSFVLSKNSDKYFSNRFDQTSGTDITLILRDEKLERLEVFDNAQSIYFIFEEKKANGMNKAEGEEMIVFFDINENVEKINILENPSGEYFPENELANTQLILPGFEERQDKPLRR